MRLIEYLARISNENKIDPNRFYNSFLDALEHEKATCGKLSIECRAKTLNLAIFLITDTQKVIAQFSIPAHILAKPNLVIEFSHSRRL
jgi:hypothetical protein